MDFSKLKMFERGGGSDEVHDGIDSTDFVEMNVVDGFAMNLGFGDGNQMKHGEGSLFDGFGEG